MDAQPLDVLRCRALHLREIKGAAAAAKARQDRKADILDEREIGQNALAKPVAGQERDPALERRRRISRGDRRSFDEDSARGLAARRPEQPPRQLAKTGAGEARDAEHLAAAQAKADILQKPREAQVLDVHQRGRFSGGAAHGPRGAKSRFCAQPFAPRPAAASFRSPARPPPPRRRA